MGERLEWTAPARAPRLDRALADAFPELSRARIQALIAEGRVTLEGEPARGKERPPEGARVVIEVPDAVPTSILPESIPLTILHEDADVIVLVKPAGMVVHPSAGHSTGTLVNALLGRPGGLSTIGGEERPGIVHRLDGGTSGVMIVARNDLAHRRLSEMFATHALDRRYLAVVHRVPLHDAGTFRSDLGRDPRDRMRIASVREREDEEDDEAPTGGTRGRHAVTHWRVRARGDRLALVECKLETGRTHQVRVHLSEAGHPIVGDPLYGRRDCIAPAGVRALAEAVTHPLLHAYHLCVEHPRDGSVLSFSVPPPEDFLAFAAAAGLAVPGAAERWG